MRVPALRRIRAVFRRETVGHDAIAGIVLGIESVPDGLASGLLAGVNPIAGLYAYLFGMAGSAVFASSALMAVQATGAMSLIVADADLKGAPDPKVALFTLSVLTGVLMIIAGLLKGGRLLRFVPTAVMVGFITAVGVNIALGQLTDFTGSDESGANRIAKAFNIVVHLGHIHWPTLAVGGVTFLMILVLTNTRLRSFGLVIAVVAGSVLAGILNGLLHVDIKTVADVANVPTGLPAPVLPSLKDVPALIVPALSLTFVGLVQGAAVSSSVPNPDGSRQDSSQDFIGQGAGNVVSGIFRGMPVGGSTSASMLIVAAGAKTRLALFIAAGVMAFVVLVASGAVSLVAMPSLAALLIVVGITSIKPARVRSVMKTGVLQTTVMAVTFVLTLLIPLQFAVLVGVGLGIVLYVARQSNRLRLRQVVYEGDRPREQDPDPTVGPHSVMLLQPDGSLFFASAPVLEGLLPRVDDATRGSVVILRLRGVDQLGLALVQVLSRYARELAHCQSSLRLVITSDQVRAELVAGGLVREIGDDSIYRGTEWLGATSRRAVADAEAWVRGADTAL